MKLPKRRTRIGLAFAVVTLILGAEWVWLSAPDARSARRDTASETVVIAPFDVDFSLIDHNGRALAMADLDERHALVMFGYTHCPDVCPTGLANLSMVLSEIGERATHVQPLFITVDPDRDTTNLLADYVDSFDSRIVGLTGTPEQVDSAARAFRVYAARVGDGPDYYFDHNAALYFVAPGGKVVAYFRPDTATDEIARVIRAVLDRPTS